MKATARQPRLELVAYIAVTTFLVVLQIVGLARGLDATGHVRHFSSLNLPYEFGFSQPHASALISLWCGLPALRVSSSCCTDSKARFAL
jgi:hypothetical protein